MKQSWSVSIFLSWRHYLLTMKVATKNYLRFGKKGCCNRFKQCGFRFLYTPKNPSLSSTAILFGVMIDGLPSKNNLYCCLWDFTLWNVLRLFRFQ